MKEEDIRFTLNYYVSHLRENINGDVMVRKVWKTDEKKLNDSNEYFEKNPDTTNINHIIFKNTFITFLKQFYGKKPQNFNTKVYQEMSKKFNDFIKDNPNAEIKIQEILNTETIDINDFNKGGIFENLDIGEIGKIYDNGMDRDEIPLQLLDKNIPGNKRIARVYINPSSQHYAHLLNYIYTESIKRELSIHTKTRYTPATKNDSDRLIIYLPKDQLGLFLNLLNDYEKENPEKVDSFNNPPLLLDKTSHSWYGFGHEVYPTTCNDDVEYMFNQYILPIIFLLHFSEIIPKEIRDRIIKKIYEIGIKSKNKDIDNLQEYLKVGSGRFTLIKDIENFEDYKSSLLLLRKNILEHKSELGFMKNHGPGSNALSNFLTKNFTKRILKDPEIKELFFTYLSNPENFDKAVQEAMILAQEYSNQITFLSGEPIYSSKELKDEKNKYKRIVLEFAKLMATRKTYSNDDIHLFNRELELFLNKVGGLYNIKIALDYSKGMESVDKNILNFVEQVLYGINGLYIDNIEENNFHK